MSYQPTEIELLARLAQGDSGAFGELYDRLATTLFGFALRILGEPSAAEDVLQEVFIQISEKAASYDPHLGKPLTWALMLTRSRAIDRLRGAQRRQRLASAAAEERESADRSTSGAVEALVSKETADRVRAALSNLPLEQRQAIEMAYFGGMSQTEIASALGTPLGTVKARIRRGMVQLRGVLEEVVK